MPVLAQLPQAGPGVSSCSSHSCLREGGQALDWADWSIRFDSGRMPCSLEEVRSRNPELQCHKGSPGGAMLHASALCCQTSVLVRLDRHHLELCKEQSFAWLRRLSHTHPSSAWSVASVTDGGCLRSFLSAGRTSPHLGIGRGQWAGLRRRPFGSLEREWCV